MPAKRQVEQFINIVNNADSKNKIIVHCLNGDERTRVMAVAYWISEGLTAEEAKDKICMSRMASVHMAVQKIAL